jgi:hypothetical protein
LVDDLMSQHSGESMICQTRIAGVALRDSQQRRTCVTHWQDLHRDHRSRSGRWLLSQALKKAVEVSISVGLYAFLVDAIAEKAKSFYVKYGFIPFEGHSLTLFLPLATVKAAIG